MYIESLVTNVLKIKIVTQDKAGHNTCRRHIPLTVNSVHRLNIGNIIYIQKILNIKYLVRGKEKKIGKKNRVTKVICFLINVIAHFKVSEFIYEVKSAAP